MAMNSPSPPIITTADGQSGPSWKMSPTVSGHVLKIQIDAHFFNGKPAVEIEVFPRRRTIALAGGNRPALARLEEIKSVRFLPGSPIEVNHNMADVFRQRQQLFGQKWTHRSGAGAVLYWAFFLETAGWPSG